MAPNRPVFSLLIMIVLPSVVCVIIHADHLLVQIYTSPPSQGSLTRTLTAGESLSELWYTKQSDISDYYIFIDQRSAKVK